MDLKESDILGDDTAGHWYYKSKASAVARILGKKSSSAILDIGAGSGFFSKHLLTNTDIKEAWCVDISYDKESDFSHAGKPLHFRKAIDYVPADLVLLMDVLEHVDDDVGLLRSYIPKVPPKSLFLISVPAFQTLWSGHDDFLEHKRRYTLDQIENVTRNSGLTVIHGAYYFGAVFPVAATTRFAGKVFAKPEVEARSQLKQHHPLVNGFLATICKAELPVMKLNRAFGLTAFCLATSE